MVRAASIPDDVPAVAIRGVTFSYDGAPALTGVDLQIEQGAFVSVVGPNGGGKTTLLKLILGLLTPDEGTVDLLGGPPVTTRRWAGYVPQRTDLDSGFPATVMDVVLTGRLGASRNVGPYRKRDREMALQAMEEVGIGDLADRYLSRISGGQRQRALIARALASNPRVLLLDEPTASLDLQVEEEFYALLKQLNQRLTVLLVSHDLAFVSQYVDQVVCVKQQVRLHATGEVSVETIRAMYGEGARVVQHHDGH